MKQNFWESIGRYKWSIAGVIIASAICALIFTIGFWRTVLIAVIVGVGFLIGKAADKGANISGTIIRLLDKILPGGYNK